MTDLIQWMPIIVNLLFVGFIAGITMHRIKSLENRMNAKSAKDDARDETLTRIRIDVAAIKETLTKRRITLW